MPPAARLSYGAGAPAATREIARGFCGVSVGGRHIRPRGDCSRRVAGCFSQSKSTRKFLIKVEAGKQRSAVAKVAVPQQRADSEELAGKGSHPSHQAEREKKRASLLSVFFQLGFGILPPPPQSFL